MDNSTIAAADRTTHAKIGAIALAASIAVVLVGMAARTPFPGDTDGRIQAVGPVMKAGKPAAISRSDVTAIR
jgi:hypothetical protein